METLALKLIQFLLPELPITDSSLTKITITENSELHCFKSLMNSSDHGTARLTDIFQMFDIHYG